MDQDEKVERAPGGLVSEQRRSRELRLAERPDWYLAADQLLQYVGSGDLSLADLQAVRAEVTGRYGERACFVAVGRPRELEEHLSNRFGTRRITWSERLGRPLAPSVRAIARGARLAVTSGGIFWVDGERLFEERKEVSLPWTSPPVELAVLRPASLRRVLEAAIGSSGPKRARLG